MLPVKEILPQTAITQSISKSVRLCQSYATTLPLRSLKSHSVHVRKVIVFFCFLSLVSLMSILGDCTLEQLPGKCSPLLHCTTILCLPALPAASVAGNCIELTWRRRKLMWRRRKLLWRRRRRMEASTKAKLQAS